MASKARKHVTSDTLDSTPEPEDDQCVARVEESIGNNQHKVLPDMPSLLDSLCLSLSLFVSLFLSLYLSSSLALFLCAELLRPLAHLHEMLHLLLVQHVLDRALQLQVL